MLDVGANAGDDVAGMWQVVGQVLLDRIVPIPVSAGGSHPLVPEQCPHRGVGRRGVAGSQPALGDLKACPLDLSGQVGGRIEGVVASVGDGERVGGHARWRLHCRIEIRRDGGLHGLPNALGRSLGVSLGPAHQRVDHDRGRDRVFGVGRVDGAVVVRVPGDRQAPTDDAVAIGVGVVEQPTAGDPCEVLLSAAPVAAQAVQLREQDHGVGLWHVTFGVARIVGGPEAGSCGGQRDVELGRRRLDARVLSFPRGGVAARAADERRQHQDPTPETPPGPAALSPRKRMHGPARLLPTPTCQQCMVAPSGAMPRPRMQVSLPLPRRVACPRSPPCNSST